MARKPNNQKIKGQSKRTARLLFGTSAGRTMESPEEREHMAIVLARSTDARVQRMVSDLMSPDPVNSASSLARIAERHGLNFHEISEEYTRLRKAEGFIRAAHKIPEIMEQVAEDATNRWAECGVCKGTGMIDSADGIKPCSMRGCVDGKVYIAASIDHLKLMFDTFGLTGKGGGVNVNLDLRKTDTPESLHDLASSLGPILEGGGK
jgi:hypothetical protein